MCELPCFHRERTRRNRRRGKMTVEMYGTINYKLSSSRNSADGTILVGMSCQRDQKAKLHPTTAGKVCVQVSSPPPSLHMLTKMTNCNGRQRRYPWGGAEDYAHHGTAGQCTSLAKLHVFLFNQKTHIVFYIALFSVRGIFSALIVMSHH